MSKSIHKGSEFNNIKETWKENEKEQEQVSTNTPSTTDENLERVIEEESSEYDNANKEERLLGGDRASVNDEDALRE
jgi:rubrerythrin